MTVVLSGIQAWGQGTHQKAMNILMSLRRAGNRINAVQWMDEADVKFGQMLPKWYFNALS